MMAIIPSLLVDITDFGPRELKIFALKHIESGLRRPISNTDHNDFRDDSYFSHQQRLKVPLYLSGFERIKLQEHRSPVFHKI